VEEEQTLSSEVERGSEWEVEAWQYEVVEPLSAEPVRVAPAALAGPIALVAPAAPVARAAPVVAWQLAERVPVPKPVEQETRPEMR
jgi:hypothetical protein